jgi:nitroreductase
MGIGHVSQNFYLATEALQCGCVSISGYIQEKADTLLDIDGKKELTILCGAVGHVDNNNRDVYANLPDLRNNNE